MQFSGSLSLGVVKISLKPSTTRSSLDDDAVAVFIGRTDAEAPIIWPPDAESTHG